MPDIEKIRASKKRWDNAHIANQTVRVYKELLASFKAKCAERGDRVNTVLRLAMQTYVDSPETPVWAKENQKGE